MATTTSTQRRSLRRRTSAYFFRHPKTKRGLTLSAPLLWLFIVYLVSFALLLANSFWRADSLTSHVVRDWNWHNYDTVFSGDWRTAFLEKTYYLMARRTVVLASLVTIADIAFAFPIAYFASRVATPRWRSAIMFAVVIPLWANYLIRVFAWKALLEGGGPAQALLRAVGLTRRLADRHDVRDVDDVLLPVVAATRSCPSTRRSSACHRRCSRRPATSARRRA